MFVNLSRIDYVEGHNPYDNPNTVLAALLGKIEKDALEKANIEFLKTASKYICQMYNTVLKCREDIGQTIGFSNIRHYLTGKRTMPYMPIYIYVC